MALLDREASYWFDVPAPSSSTALTTPFPLLVRSTSQSRKSRVTLPHCLRQTNNIGLVPGSLDLTCKSKVPFKALSMWSVASTAPNGPAAQPGVLSSSCSRPPKRTTVPDSSRDVIFRISYRAVALALDDTAHWEEGNGAFSRAATSPLLTRMRSRPPSKELRRLDLRFARSAPRRPCRQSHEISASTAISWT